MPEIDLRVLTTAAQPTESVFEPMFSRLSSWNRMVRVTRFILRGLHRWASRASIRTTHIPQPDQAVTTLIRDTQREHFRDSMRRLQAGEPLLARDRLLRLNPYVDQFGTLRVGGRRRLGAEPSFDARHPALLPDSAASQALIRYIHARAAHQGRHVTSGAVREAGFHPIKTRVVRTVVSSCTTCRRLRAAPMQQMMADLPPDRLAATAAFDAIGVDVFGPFLIARGKTTRSEAGCAKVWGLLATCLASRAVHVEVLDSLDFGALRLALRRLVAVRGPISIIRSDRGTNFLQAADSDLDLGPSGGPACRWLLNPAAAPHCGGVWERQVGLVKQAFAGCVAFTAGRFLSRPEFTTLLLEAAAIVNDTPLWAVQASPDDPTPLCPSRLLTLKTSTPATMADLSQADTIAFGPKRWRRVQALADQFWKGWRSAFLADLHQRSKWKRPSRSAAIGDVVLLRDQASKRSEWPFGIISEVFPGPDGLVRRVSVRVPGRRGSAGGSGKFLRHISQLVLIHPADGTDNDMTDGNDSSSSASDCASTSDSDASEITDQPGRRPAEERRSVSSASQTADRGESADDSPSVGGTTTAHATGGKKKKLANQQKTKANDQEQQSNRAATALRGAAEADQTGRPGRNRRAPDKLNL